MVTVVTHNTKSDGAGVSGALHLREREGQNQAWIDKVLKEGKLVGGEGMDRGLHRNRSGGKRGTRGGRRWRPSKPGIWVCSLWRSRGRLPLSVANQFPLLLISGTDF